MTQVSSPVLGGQNSTLDNHAKTIGTIASLASAASTPFLSDYRAIGYTFAGSALVLTAVVALMQAASLGVALRRGLVLVISLLALSSVGLLGWAIEHPVVKPGATTTPPVAAAPPTIRTEGSHDTYEIKTTEKNSPVITGGNAPIYVGDTYGETPHHRKRK